jgi:hypothetical protein
LSHFKTPLDVRLLPETDDPKWMLLAPLVYHSDIMGCDVEAPAGFITNFVSFDLLKNVGHRAAAIHDYLYSCCDIDRRLADRVFREALSVVCVDEELAEAMYLAVRIAGGGHKENLYTFYQGVTP